MVRVKKEKLNQTGRGSGDHLQWGQKVFTKGTGGASTYVDKISHQRSKVDEGCGEGGGGGIKTGHCRIHVKKGDKCGVRMKLKSRWMIIEDWLCEVGGAGGVRGRMVTGVGGGGG